MIDDQVDCIVRLHDSSRLLELERCVFSLVGQKHSQVRIILATQRFSHDEIAAVRHALAPMLSLSGAPSLTIVNWESPDPTDARTELLNLGLTVLTGRYVSFLDYDDTLFPEAYELLIERLKTTQAAIAFASVRTVKADVHADFVHVSSHPKAPFAGCDVVDLMQGNFCPIHSYLIDRSRLPANVLRFDTSLVWEEDYDLLLRICACKTGDFHSLSRVIGDYYFKTDGSNSIWTDDVLSESKKIAYEQVAGRIEMRRRLTRVSLEVQRTLLDEKDVDPQLTLRGLLDLRTCRRDGVR
jgi:hypothetical protein